MLADDPRLKSLPDAPRKLQGGRSRRSGETLAPRSPRPATGHPRHREKLFGWGKGRPLDRNARARLEHRARCLMRRTEKGRAYGAVTAKAFAILKALLWGFHNAKDGRCFPSYARIAEAADCAASTVAEAIKALEAAGLMTWDNRVKRIRERCPDLLGPNGWRWRVVRTSNAYKFNDPASDSENRRGTEIQVLDSSPKNAAAPKNELDERLAEGLARFAEGVRRKAATKPA
jgi:Helix-turn-helix domain